MNDDHVRVEAKIPDRFERHGFGTFLSNVEPGEVEITREAFDVLINCPERGGLQGLEVWKEKRIAWGSPEPRLEIPKDKCSVEEGSAAWLVECVIVDG